MHMAQLMPLQLTVSCFGKIHIGFTPPVPVHPGSPGQRAVKRVCVRVCAVQNAEATDERRRGYAPPAPRSSIEKQQVALRAAVSPPSEKRETASSSAAFQSDSAEGASGVSAAVAAAAAAAAALSHQRMLMSSPALPFDRVSLACVPPREGHFGIP